MSDTSDEIRARHAALADELRAANEAYYNRDAPIMSDADYDAKFRELEALEREHPELKADDSPTTLPAASPRSARATSSAPPTRRRKSILRRLLTYQYRVVSYLHE